MLDSHPTERLALGTAQFGLNYGIANQSGMLSKANVREILRTAWDCGIRTLDTASSYGKSEQVLGDCGAQNWEVITKIPPVPQDCGDAAAWVKKHVNGSLKKLGIDHLYAVLLHRPNQIFEGSGPQILDSLEEIKSFGLTQKIGISIYDPKELSGLTEMFQFDLVQAPMSILDQRL